MVHTFSKAVWKNVWYIDEDWKFTSSLFSDTHYLKTSMVNTQQCLVWWDISNRHQGSMKMCENMAKLTCRCSNLKSDSVMYKGTNHNVRACSNCDLFHEKNVEHI